LCSRRRITTPRRQNPLPEAELHVEKPLQSPLEHQFETLDQQRHADTLGMWVFLATEILFFGGLIAAYLMYRVSYPEGFALASRSTEAVAGLIMTLVLLGSSFTVVMAVHSSHVGSRARTSLWLAITIVLGAAFLVIKFTEYYHHWEEHHIPGAGWHWEGPYSRVAQLFTYFYFALTGVHATHMVIGISVFLVLLWRARRNTLYNYTVEISALYWHFVDIVWIFLYPLIYLVDRHK
jgi:cytochrome c oxidase subunit 3